MPELKERLRTDLSAAMRTRDQVRLRTLRMALTAITNEEVAGASSRELSDDEIVKVLTREAKKRREAADAFGSACRAEQAAAERAEGEVLAEYLPAQLGDEELTRLVTEVIAETGAAGMPGHGPGHEGRHPAGGGPRRRSPGRRRGAPPAGGGLLKPREIAAATAGSSCVRSPGPGNHSLRRNNVATE